MSNVKHHEKSVVTEVDGGLFLPLSPRVLEVLQAKVGDELQTVHDDRSETVLLTRSDVNAEIALRTAREFMRKYKSAFESLAKS